MGPESEQARQTEQLPLVQPVEVLREELRDVD